MNRNLIFTIIVILLATLSMVNAIPHQLHKRATTFVPCTTGSPNKLAVSIQPDPPVPNGQLLVTVSGTLTTGTIAAGSKIIYQAFDNTGAPLSDQLSSDICSGATCPLEAGTSFSITNKFQTGYFPATYTIAVGIADATGAALACYIGTITGA